MRAGSTAKHLARAAWLTGVALVLTFATGALTPAAAQDAKAEISVGYQYSHISGDGKSTNIPGGWYTDVARRVGKRVSVVLEAGGARFHTLMVGVRVNATTANRRIVPFAQMLVGGANLSGDVSVASAGMSRVEADSRWKGALQVQGGVILMASPNIGVRLGVDYHRVFILNDVGFAVGVTVPFGR